MKSKITGYYPRKDAGICVNCGKNQARPGRTNCFECAIKKSESAHKRWVKNHGGIERPLGRPKSKYALVRDGIVLLKGDVEECRKYLGVTKGTVYHHAASGKPFGYDIKIYKRKANL